LKARKSGHASPKGTRKTKTGAGSFSLREARGTRPSTGGEGKRGEGGETILGGEGLKQMLSKKNGTSSEKEGEKLAGALMKLSEGQKVRGGRTTS